MRAVIQRVEKSSVRVNEKPIGTIGNGLMVLLGVGREDGFADVRYLCDKIVNLRIFEDDRGKMNRSLVEIGGEMLVVSQFTLYGDCRKGRRPSFTAAAEPEKANDLYEQFVSCVKKNGIAVQTGRFQAVMSVCIVNDGPVTLIIDSKEKKKE
ncbi:MAG: D-aminoacyl-tRNA deacylase [Desulfobacterales bacterium]